MSAGSAASRAATRPRSDSGISSCWASTHGSACSVNSGLPSVRWCTRATSSEDTGRWSRWLRCSRVCSGSRRDSATTVTSSSRTSSAYQSRRCASRGGSSVRRVRTSSTRSSRRLRTRKLTRSSVDRSAQCRSSSTTSTGGEPGPLDASSVRVLSTFSRSRPWLDRLAGTSPSAGRPGAGARRSSGASSCGQHHVSRARSSGPSARPRSRNAWITGAYGVDSPATGKLDPRSTRAPDAAAKDDTSLDLPMPTSPDTRASPGVPSEARASRSPRVSCSVSRSTRAGTSVSWGMGFRRATVAWPRVSLVPEYRRSRPGAAIRFRRPRDFAGPGLRPPRARI